WAGSRARREEAEPQRAENDSRQCQAHAQDDEHGTIQESRPRLDAGLDFSSGLVAHSLLLARFNAARVNAGQLGRVPVRRRGRRHRHKGCTHPMQAGKFELNEGNKAMLGAEKNDLLTRTGAGTPAGRLMRCYWQPAALVDELSDNRPLKPVRLLGESLVL